MKPTWLERRRGLFWSQAVCNGLAQFLVIPAMHYFWWPALGFSWVNIVFGSWAALCLALWAVGYRRRRQRMVLVMLDIAVNANEPYYVHRLYFDNIIDYKTMERFS